MANSHTLQFYLDRAEQAREDAEAATLSNVRERCRRAEAAWLQMAERAASTERKREQQLMLKTATRQSSDETAAVAANLEH